MNKKMSLLVSPSGNRVAVVICNQLTIFNNSDNYRKPYGVYKNVASGNFIRGMWSESRDILGILDDSGMLIFIQENGEELLKIERKHLNFPSPIIFFRFNDDTDANYSYLCTVDIITSDGLLHCAKISENRGFSLSSTHAKRPDMDGRTFPNNILCVDYFPDISLLALVGNVRSTSWISKINKGIIFGPKFGYSGPCGLSIWRISRNSSIEPLFSVDIDGEFFKSRGYMGSLTHPKVMFSPGGRFVSTLDLVGTLNIYNIDEGGLSLLRSVRANLKRPKNDIHISGFACHNSSDIISDFVWLSDQVITFSSSPRGALTMLDVISGLQLSKNGTLYSMPVLESAKKSKGLFFLLETTSSSYPSSSNASDFIEISDSTHVDNKNCWRLLSFFEGYIAEMYYFFIEGKQYEDALRFADNHGLEKDEVFKSQWLCSEKKLHEINSFLLNIKDKDFALDQCMINVASDEVSMRALLTHGLFLTENFKFSMYDGEIDERIWSCRLQRLKLLQFQDRLETFMGINMGRYLANEYTKFRSTPIEEVAISLAEAGKIGALNLLFKLHSYSLVASMLKVLSAVPETVPVDSYSQVLPGRLPPKAFLREKDWVENEEMVSFMSDPSSSFSIDIISSITEPIAQHFLESTWPSAHDLCLWYKNRARDIDICSGNLDNCLILINYAFGKDLWELQEFRDDIFCLHQLVYSTDSDQDVIMLSISSWEKLSDYEKFKMMLTGVEGETLIQRLHKIAVPFMKSRFSYDTLVPENGSRFEYLSVEDGKNGSFLVRWLKDVASDKQLELCLMVIDEGCKSFLSGIFKDAAEAVSGALECIYSCKALDMWNIMDEILSKVQQIQDDELSPGDMSRKLKSTAGYIEAGRILSFYQVSKPLYYFLEASSDEKGVKQIIRLMLSKFIRRKPCPDNDWADMWRDMQFLHDKAFCFIDLEYMFLEFFRGLLKAGRFSLAKNYLQNMFHLSIDKAEIIVIQTSREYLFSASSLTSPEIWKAMECLKLLPRSGKANSEIEVIEALTVKLPELGVTLLPIQLKEIKDPMTVVKAMMANQQNENAHPHFDHILTITKQLGLLNSPHDISSVEEAVAREAAIAGDLHLALTLCLSSVEKGNGSVWDLCAAIGRGPPLDSVDWSTRKTLLGFALSHCDEQSIGELLPVWKAMDLQAQWRDLGPPPAGGGCRPLLDALVDTRDVFFTDVRLLLSVSSARSIANYDLPIPETVTSALMNSSSRPVSGSLLETLPTLGSDVLSFVRFREPDPTDAPLEPSSPSGPPTVESATSRFIGLCDAEGSFLDDLPSVLEMWGRDLEGGTVHVEESGTGDWNDGWETEECKTESPVFLHPLHKCWLILFKKLVKSGRSARVRTLLRNPGSEPKTLLLDEEDATALILELLNLECFEALKISLLLPYTEVQLRCLSAAEGALKGAGGGPPEGMEDGELLLLLLFSGMAKRIITEPGFEAVFSCLCQIIGFFCGRVKNGEVGVFERVVFPCFVARLVAGGKVLAAGFIAMKASGVDTSIAGVNATDVWLRMYLQKQMVVEERWDVSERLLSPFSASFVRDSLNSILTSALFLLSY